MMTLSIKPSLERPRKRCQCDYSCETMLKVQTASSACPVLCTTTLTNAIITDASHADGLGTVKLLP